MYAKKIGAIAAGAIMVGAALAGSVSAAFDDTGLDMGFFYDAAYNPVAQIAVGEKGMATDAVAAGNIAATVGNLAYTSAAADVSITPEGKVVLGVSAMGATGKYVQDTENAALVDTFYDEDYDSGYNEFEGDTTYERGDFISYSLACDQQTRSDAGLLMKGTYNNIHCLFCQTLCLDQIENPAHEMEEKIEVDSDTAPWWYYESGVNDDDSEELKLAIPEDSIVYVVDTECIPTKRVGTEASPSGDDIIDFEWRGKIIFFGEEYYVRDIKGDDRVYISKGKILDDVSSEGYTSEYLGYKFKIDHLIYSEEYQVAGILLDVEKPDGTVVQVQISKQANGIVDDIEIAGVYAEEADALATASIIVYDSTTNILLEDGEDLEMGGEEWDDWEVDLDVIDTTDDGDCDVDEYDDVTEGTDQFLEQYSVTYTQDLDGDDSLEVDEYLEFPKTFKLMFMGFRTNDFQEVMCSGQGEGNILIEEGDLDYSLEISFTGDDGNRYNNVRLDEGPYTKGDLMVVNGVIWELYDAEEDSDDDTVELTFDNIMFGGKERRTLDLVPEEDDPWTFETVPRVDAYDDDDEGGEYENKEDIEVDPDDGDVYESGETFGGLDLLYDDGELYFSDDLSDEDQLLQVNCDMIGDLDDFELSGNDLTVSCVEESGTDLNDESSAVSNSPDTDDILVVVENEDAEIALIDFYDQDYNENEDYEYDNSVIAINGAVNDSGNDAIVAIDDDNDEVLILPQGGDTFTVDWGSDEIVEAVELCHPQEEVDVTYFIGTDETSTVMETTITKEDEGATKTAGCCTFTVEEFSVTAGEEAEVTQASVNPITGNLVVAESDADLTKNLVVVGGPAVNGLCTVTAEEIGAADKKYIVKKDGSRLIVAGYEAEDTIAAGDELIEWLNDNLH
jgi:hypothetical protein